MVRGDEGEEGGGRGDVGGLGGEGRRGGERGRTAKNPFWEGGLMHGFVGGLGAVGGFWCVVGSGDVEWTFGCDFLKML